jgi:hypothetical protein
MHRAYVAVAVPGGTAAERPAGVASGTSRAFERALFEANAAAGYPLGRLGGKFGMASDAETVRVEMAFAPDVIEEALGRVVGWIRCGTLGDLLSAIERGHEEVWAARATPKAQLWRALLSQLLETSGDRPTGPSTPCPTVEDLSRYVEFLSRMRVGVGAVACRRQLESASPAQCDHRPPWAPAAVAIARRPREVTDLPSVARAPLVLVGRVVAGRSSPAAWGSYAVHQSLTLGWAVPPDELLELLGHRRPEFTLRMYRDFGVLAAFAAPATSDAVLKVAAAMLQLVAEAPVSDPERLRRCALHHLQATLDHPRERTAEEALRLLYGTAPLEAVESRVRGLGPDEVEAEVMTAMIGNPVAVVAR